MVKNTSYPKAIVKIEGVWYDVAFIDYKEQTIKAYSKDELTSFDKVQEFRVIWEG